MPTRLIRPTQARLAGRAVVVASSVLLMLPATASAQRIPRGVGIGRRAPTQPAPLPPQAPEISRDLRYRYSSFSMETYSLFSVTRTDRYVSDSSAATYGTQGAGLRLDWRRAQSFSWTLDVASSLVGGPFMMQTVAVGGRYHPNRLEEVVQPFVDLRGSWAHTYDAYAQPVGNSILVSPFSYIAGRTESNGFGGFTGAGMDYRIARNYAITSEIGLSRHRLGSVAVDGTHMGSEWNYTTTTASFVIGLKYTGGRYIQLDPTMVRQR